MIREIELSTGRTAIAIRRLDDYSTSDVEMKDGSQMTEAEWQEYAATIAAPTPKPAKVNPFRFFEQLRNNADAFTASRITLTEFSVENKRIWLEADLAGQTNAVMDLWRRANPVRQETLFDNQSTLLI